ncbi:MAG: PE-PPE domain-containing protein [Bacteroidetes bacterium]|nr:MAG: PE-PPE domain-containing protein [Bacteroidota bacterium]
MHEYKITERGVPLDKAEKAIILIHGRGAPPEDILSLADFFETQKSYIVAPEATHYVWYPLSFLAPRDQNQPWLDSALENINRLINDIQKHITTENIFIMGFSQGACLTAEVTSRNAQKYGGIAIFTGGLIGAEIDSKNYEGNFDGTPVYLSNGDNDPHIPLKRTEDTFEILGQMGAKVTKEILHGRPHTIQMQEIDKVKQLFGL